LGYYGAKNESGSDQPVLPSQASTLPSISEVAEVLSHTKHVGKLWDDHPGKAPACDAATWTCMQRLGFNLPTAGLDRYHIQNFCRSLCHRLKTIKAATKRLKHAAKSVAASSSLSEETRRAAVIALAEHERYLDSSAAALVDSCLTAAIREGSADESTPIAQLVQPAPTPSSTAFSSMPTDGRASIAGIYSESIISSGARGGRAHS
jgi:hypothetical protein